MEMCVPVSSKKTKRLGVMERTFSAKRSRAAQTHGRSRSVGTIDFFRVKPCRASEQPMVATLSVTPVRFACSSAISSRVASGCALRDRSYHFVVHAERLPASVWARS